MVANAKSLRTSNFSRTRERKLVCDTPSISKKQEDRGLDFYW